MRREPGYAPFAVLFKEIREMARLAGKLSDMDHR